VGAIFSGEILPAIAYLTQLIPGGENQVLLYCLPSRAVMGGYRSLIEASKKYDYSGNCRARRLQNHQNILVSLPKRSLIVSLLSVIYSVLAGEEEWLPQNIRRVNLNSV